MPVLRSKIFADIENDIHSDDALEPCHAVDHLLEAVLAEPLAFIMLELLCDRIKFVTAVTEMAERSAT